MVVTLATTAGAAQDALRVPRAEVLTLDMIVEPQPLAVKPATTGAAGTVWEHRIPASAVTTAAPGQSRDLERVRVLVRFSQPLPAGHVLRFLDAAGTEVERLQTAQNAGPIEFWSRTIPGKQARVTLTRTLTAPTPEATIFFAYPVFRSEPQSIFGKNQLEPAAGAPERFQRLGRPVARLRFMIQGEGQATCTAFAVGARLILTNQHCITNDSERDSALVDFHFDSRESRLTELRVTSVVSTSPELDYALLRLAADPPANTGRLYFAPVSWTWSTNPHGHPLFIVQHPNGRPKMVSMADCRLDGALRAGVQPGDLSDFGHQCDTLGGSSGSPVMDFGSGLVVGLHHFGFLPGAKSPVNQAVIHTRILEDVRKKDAAAHAEMTLPRP
jgi:hypothetical protein